MYATSLSIPSLQINKHGLGLHMKFISTYLILPIFLGGRSSCTTLTHCSTLPTPNQYNFYCKIFAVNFSTRINLSLSHRRSINLTTWRSTRDHQQPKSLRAGLGWCVASVPLPSGPNTGSNPWEGRVINLKKSVFVKGRDRLNDNFIRCSMAWKQIWEIWMKNGQDVKKLSILEKRQRLEMQQHVVER